MSDLAELRALRATNLAAQNDYLAAQIRTELAKSEIAEIEVLNSRMSQQAREAQPGINRSLNFFGAITPTAVENCIESLQFWARRDPGEPMTITFNSPGGSVIDGLALYDAILRLRREGHVITTRASGLAASMAAIVLQAGDTRIMDERAFMLIHEISSSAVGKFSEMENEMIFVKKLQDTLLEILAERSSLSKREVARRWKLKDWWLSANEALKLGLVDVVE